MQQPAGDNQYTETLFFDDSEALRVICGEHDAHLKTIAAQMQVAVHVRGNQITLRGTPPHLALAKQLLQDLFFIVDAGYRLSSVDVMHAIKMLKDEVPLHLKDVFLDTIIVSSRRKAITPKSYNQKRYVDAIRGCDIVFGIGPAGTGKTYLAMAVGIASLMQKHVDRIILARPAVEAGEKLGFLPGDLFEKVNPYLRPLYDALHDIMDIHKAQEMIQSGIIEVAPLAFMRGRTLNDSFVILDEAQNTTSEQMKMFLTRLGFNSKAVITGDITQIDLPPGTVSGLVEAQKILHHIKGISFITFHERDVVRHPLVEDIIRAYDTVRSRGEKRR
ncbi:MAG: PhoH family protein [Desulfobacterota bacterium]|nr:PhoH family protein [Thermodesulfobacteriota bacterium]